MNRSLLTPRLIILVVTLLASPFALGVEHACPDCHGSSTPDSTDLKKPLSTLCVDCHQARIAAGEHAVDIPVNPAESLVLPMDNGKMTCITCHDPHGSSLALRMTDPELCSQCHKR